MTFRKGKRKMIKVGSKFKKVIIKGSDSVVEHELLVLFLAMLQTPEKAQILTNAIDSLNKSIKTMAKDHE
jgi:hypothetical protein